MLLHIHAAASRRFVFAHQVVAHHFAVWKDVMATIWKLCKLTGHCTMMPLSRPT